MASKVRLLEYLLIGAGTTSVLVILWLIRPWLLLVIIPVLPGVVVAVWLYLPQSCVVEGRRALLKMPGRYIEVEFLEEPKLVKAGIWPKKRIFLGIGYRSLTLHAVFGKEYFFSTPNRDKTWLVAKARVGNKEKKVWLSGCTRK